MKNGRWAGLATLIQVFALFWIADLNPDRPATVVPLVLIACSALLCVNGWTRLKGW
jgi:hypothetical protein